MENRFEALADQLMVGAYDLHLHSLPSVFERSRKPKAPELPQFLTTVRLTFTPSRE